MTSHRPKLAVIVGNYITGDSRVQKTAIAAARAGWDVTLIGRSSSKEIERSWLGGVRVLRVPVKSQMTRVEAQRRGRPRATRFAQTGLPTARDVRLQAAAAQARSRRRAIRVAGFEGAAGALPRFAVKVWNRVDLGWTEQRSRLWRWGSRHRVPDVPLGEWRRDRPQLLDIDMAFGPVIEELQPHVIHANDSTMINTAATASARLRARGHDCAWIYDAHEYVAGVEWPYPRMASALPQVEAEFITKADAVLTVSPELAELLHREHRLPVLPSVVRNAPVQSSVGRSRASVRDQIGLDPTSPLLVYSGYVHPARGIATAVEGLLQLADYHLAIVAGGMTADVRALLDLAEGLGVQDRVHVAPYVPQHEVPDYLSSADIAVICFERTPNHEISLPTKVPEYLHARLPIVSSDVAAISSFLQRTNVGEVFTSGDPTAFATAVEKLGSDLTGYRDRITQEMLDELSWERQSEVALNLYSELSTHHPTPPVEPTPWEAVETRRRSGAKAKKPRHEPSSSPDWRQLTATPVRLGLGPANSAGQLAAIAKAVTDQRPDVSAEVFEYSSASAFGYPTDVRVWRNSLKRLDIQLEQVQRILPNYTHLLADGFRPVFGPLNGTNIGADLPALLHAGIHVGLLAHGSEIRHPARHQDDTPYSLFRDAPPGMVETLTKITESNLAVIDQFDLTTFVTTPDLLADLPSAIWLPLVVDVDTWANDNPILERDRPIVLHAPSKRWTKGTDRFLGSLEEMHTAGTIELQLLEGLPWSEMRQRVQEADIVVDQVAIGSYGAFACEAMAAGKPVLAWLSETAIGGFEEEPPIINVTPAAMRASIERLLDDRHTARQIGAASAEYAQRMHDGRRTAELLRGFLDRS